jgi:hypothetical protein
MKKVAIIIGVLVAVFIGVGGILPALAKVRDHDEALPAVRPRSAIKTPPAGAREQRDAFGGSDKPRSRR